MKKIIQFLLIIILLAVITLIVVVVFNPSGSRDKIIGGVIDSYFSNNISGYESLPADAPVYEKREFDNPLLNDSQEKALYDMGVDTSKLPTEMTDGMQACFVDKLGLERVTEIANGASPSNTEIYKTKDCIGK